ncbi:MAG: hypothetical protein EBR82_29985 [Caulobacteraceae bacterium]|nr:hypothetical protein [Caulobacteraceae bacterium]
MKKKRVVSRGLLLLNWTLLLLQMGLKTGGFVVKRWDLMIGLMSLQNYAKGMNLFALTSILITLPPRLMTASMRV